MRKPTRALTTISLLALTFLQLVPFRANAFTQSGFGTIFSNTIPMGHEWLTRRAAIELLLGNDPLMRPDPNDPRIGWRGSGKGLAKNLDLKGAQSEVARIKGMLVRDSRYQSGFRPVFDAIIGERWVDIGGVNVFNANLPKNVDCWNAVAQEPAEIQYDHFMRRYDDAGGAAGVRAAKESQARFVKFFVAAATAPPMSILVWDGGAATSLEKVDRNYFLFGRAVHVFQDSFSSEHTVRIVADNHEKVRQVKAFFCAYGSEQHTHSKLALGTYKSGDVIWLPGTQFVGTDWSTYRPSFMKTTALVAMEATKDLWAAFIRTMALPPADRKRAAEAEAQKLVANWLSFDETEMTNWYDDPKNRDATYVLNPGEQPPGQLQTTCVKENLEEKSGRQSEVVKRVEAVQRLCLYNMLPAEGYADQFDPQIHMFYNWKWLSLTTWAEPPRRFGLPVRQADMGRLVTIRSASRGQPMSAKLENNTEIKVDGGAPTDFVVVREDPDSPFNQNVFLRARFDPYLFLSYSATSSGTVKLWAGTKESAYQLASAGNATSIMNTHWKQYIWADDQGRVFLTKAGDPKKPNAQWAFEPAR